MKGNGMKMTKKNAAIRLTVATVLSLGLSAGVMGVGSASAHGTHEAQGSSWTEGNAVKGVVSGYVAGSLISIEAHGTTPATTYALTSATTITGLATGASLLNDKVVLTLSITTPATVLSIKVETNHSKCHGDKDGDGSSIRNSFSHGSSGQDHDHGNFSKHGSFRR